MEELSNLTEIVCGSLPRKGEVFAYFGSIPKLKDLTDSIRAMQVLIRMHKPAGHLTTTHDPGNRSLTSQPWFLLLSSLKVSDPSVSESEDVRANNLL